MPRRVLVSGAVGAVLVGIALLVMLWVAGLPVPWSVAGSLLLVAGGIGGAVALRSALVVFRERLNQGATRDRNLQGRLDQTNQTLDTVDEGQLILASRLQGEERAREKLAGELSDLAVSRTRNADRISEQSEVISQHTSDIAELMERSRSLVEEVDQLKSRESVARERLDELESQAEESRHETSVQTKELWRQAHATETLKAQLRNSESATTSLTSEIAQLEIRMFENAVAMGRRPDDVLTQDDADRIAREYFAAGRLLQIKPLLESFDVEAQFNLTATRTVYKFFRRFGYFALQEKLSRRIAELSRKPQDFENVARISSEIAVYSDTDVVTADLGVEKDLRDVAGPVLHIVGKVLPATQTGYTLRTHYSMRALVDVGVPVVVVCQSGALGGDADERVAYELDGVRYVILAGPERTDVTYEQWLRHNTEELADVVRSEYPSILHAHSDFFNAVMMNRVGSWYGVPTVYETRGFWEESWLSRALDALRDHGLDEESLRTYGMPEAYELRQRAEIVMRERSDVNISLGRAMESHIRRLAAPGAIEDDSIPLIPNGIDPDSFTVQERDRGLAESLGIDDDDIVIGYVSSIVEYEGIDILLRAFDALRRNGSDEFAKAKLLLVGDGDRLQALKDYVRNESVPDVVFTGRVPHEDILRYYGLIDLFVVPRRPSLVSRLVTPLKPYEALASGRAVLVSDVDALKEISEDSGGAVETFAAGDPDALASVLERLLRDPDRRREMASAGAEWVRRHRTWHANALGYARVYRSLGMQVDDSFVLDARLGLAELGIEPQEHLAEVARLDAAPVAGWFQPVSPQQNAHDVRTEGWIHDGFDAVRLDDLDDWGYFGHTNRSWGFHLQTWALIDPFLEEYDKGGDTLLLDEMLRVVWSWLRYEVRTDDASSMAHYDMAVSMRTPRVLALLTRLARHSDYEVQALVLLNLAIAHEHELAEDEAFNPHTNHGFYTAAAQIHVAKYLPNLPGAERAAEMGRERMRQMLETQFATDGGHLEHSPAYQMMLLRSFRDAIADEIIEDASIIEIIERAEHVLGWMIQPDGTLVQLGDTPAEDVRDLDPKPLDPAARFLTTSGREGTPAEETLLVLPESGYAFVRSPQPRTSEEMSRSSYLAFQAGFHSRAHKHADDLSFVWFDRGTPIIVDAGRYGYGDLLPIDDEKRRLGYYYDSEERQYVESTVAHNTLEVDGIIQDRRREPYGSALHECTSEAGIYDLVARATHRDYAHRRRLTFQPGHRLEIQDSVYSKTMSDRYGIVWFNVNGDLELVEDADALRFLLPDGRTTLVVESNGERVDPVKGQIDPLRGWRSLRDRELEPSWSFGFRFPVEVRGGVKTVLRLEG